MAETGTAAGRARGAERLLGPSQALLLLLVPLTWVAPLFTARVPWLWREQVSILSALASLWGLDRLLFAAVLGFSLVIPVAKALLGLWLWYLVPAARAASLAPALALLGKLAMTEVFLVAVAIVGFKGVGLGRVETAWGVWLLTGVVVAALAVSLWLEHALGRLRPGRGGQARATSRVPTSGTSGESAGPTRASSVRR